MSAAAASARSRGRSGSERLARPTVTPGGGQEATPPHSWRCEAGIGDEFREEKLESLAALKESETSQLLEVISEMNNKKKRFLVLTQHFVEILLDADGCF